MTNTYIKNVLLEHGVNRLFHTNTVETSLSFLKSGGLLSRGLCLDMRMPQTVQYTDNLDRAYNIFYDIFFDSINIQRRTGISYYGPVLFVYSVDLLDIIEEGHIRITKMNPDKWRNTSNDNDRYFNGEEELAFRYDSNDFGQHITLTHQIAPLPFSYLEKIELSDPHCEDNSLFQTADKAIRSVITAQDMNVCYQVRDYNYNERFYETYKNTEIVIKHFGLGGHNL